MNTLDVNTPDNLPSDLLLAISADQGGRVVLVIGAGCSFESPTSLPLARECAIEVHRRLVEDGVLNIGDCLDPEDLSSVADAVFTINGLQGELVRRLPVDRFRHAEPNEGHLLAAAMLREKAIGCVVTLNFDLAMSSALSRIGARGDVAEIASPLDHERLGTANLIYLHRNVNADPEEWTLRSAALEVDWKNGWQQVVAQHIVVSPVTVFIGLGMSAAVFVDSTKRIRESLDGIVQMLFVNPGKQEESEFFSELGLPSAAYIPMAWVPFMRQLAQRLVAEHKAALEQACNELITAGGWEAEDTPSLCSRLSELGLLGLGSLRARWTLDNAAYSTREQVQMEWLADLLLAVGLIERTTGAKAKFYENGVVEFLNGDTVLSELVLAHGLGFRTWSALETKINQNNLSRAHRGTRPLRALVSGVTTGRPEFIAPPLDITVEEQPEDIISGNSGIEVYETNQLRDSPETIHQVIR